MTTKLLHYLILIIYGFCFISCSSPTYNRRGKEIFSSKRIGVLETISIIDKGKKKVLNKENSMLINNYLIDLINRNNIAFKINTDTSTLYSAYKEIFEMENLLNSFKNNKAKKRFISGYKFSNEFYQLLEKNNLDQIVFTLQEGTIISQSTRNLNTAVEALTFPSKVGWPIPLKKDESFYKTWVIESKSKLIVFRNVTNDISDPLKQKSMPLQICYLFNGFYTRMSDTNSCFVLETK